MACKIMMRVRFWNIRAYQQAEAEKAAAAAARHEEEQGITSERALATDKEESGQAGARGSRPAKG